MDFWWSKLIFKKIPYDYFNHFILNLCTHVKHIIFQLAFFIIGNNFLGIDGLLLFNHLINLRLERQINEMNSSKYDKCAIFCSFMYFTLWPIQKMCNVKLRMKIQFFKGMFILQLANIAIKDEGSQSYPPPHVFL